jgi:K+-sensing histidine kinase KdpD
VEISRTSVLQFSQRRTVGYAASVLGIVLVALALRPFYPNVRSVTAATALMIVVLLSATIWGMRPAVLASVLGAVYMNFFFVPPTGQFELQLADGDDFIALLAFLVTAVLVGQLSARARERARKVQELYDQLRGAFEVASQLEAIKQSEALKSALLDTVTHDLRTPLTSIKAAATALLDLNRNNPTDHSTALWSEENLVHIIVQQSDRLNHFIEGMIELARIETGKQEENLDSEEIAVEEIIAAALARCDDTLAAHVVIVECEESLITGVKPKAVGQILFSLLENAGQYSLPGSAVRISAKRQADEDIEIAVEDEGPGVPAALRERIFEKFFRNDVTDLRTVQRSGLGLGLAIARGIVQAYGGRIWVSDRSPEAGAKFVFTVPAKHKSVKSELV